MLKKSYWFYLFVLASCQSVSAQYRLSVEAGPMLDYIRGPYSGSFKNHRNGGVGYSLSAAVDFYKHGRFFFSAGAGWIAKTIGYKHPESSAIINQSESYRFVQVPVSLGARIFKKKLSVETQIGGVVNYWLYTVIEGYHPNIFDIETGNDAPTFANTYFKERQYPDRYDNRLQYGCFIGLSFFYPISSTYSLFFNNRYYYFFTFLEKNPSPSGRYRFTDLSVAIGISRTIK